MNLFSLTAHELLDRIRSKTSTPQEICRSLKERIQSVDGQVKALVRTREEAQILSEMQAASAVAVPIVIKDNICLKGEETTCASKILKGFKPPYSATVVEKLKDKGCAVFGQANMDEFAFGSSTE